MALLVMFNNFFHDLTAALWLCSAAVIWWLTSRVKRNGHSQVARFYSEIFPTLFRVSLGSLVLNLLFGVGRALAYYQYEYLPAAGRGQVTALIIKHILLFSVVLLGIVIEIRAYRLQQQLKAGDA
ncbi:hypothetical protein [Calderihabitans maritimus]|uniref:Uncharacterized protein n=1 Tax=Calderihabitans maritimus TaxID=1246530 RepID=A0A1Z5HVN4_9FIRM|nr:hypothetical protein [Calderihabitans maritimus]GAW93596.1 hypothetical protein TherJR_2217 [Calderihabitans maritimus]